MFLESTSATAVLFTFALGRLLGIYQQILDIRLKHRELSEDDDVPDEALKPLTDYVNNKMGDEIRVVAEEVIAKATLPDKDRLNELRNELTNRLNSLADRIDRGFNVEVRAGEIPESTDDDEVEAQVSASVREASQTVLKAQKDLEFMNVSGKPILHLDKPVDTEDLDKNGRD